MRKARRGGAIAQSEDPRQTAERGVSGPGSDYPHRGQIEQAFGSSLNARAHTDGAAREASDSLSAQAYTTGNDVAFRSSSPDLHTAAHEATHVLQQRAGIQLKDGSGEAGDEHERQADAVADRVVSGESVSREIGSLVSRGPGSGPTKPAGIQRQEGGGAAAADDEPDPSSRTTATRHRVVRGDTLWELAEEYLGGGRRWRAIRDANPEKVHGEDTIRVGAMLTIPPASGADEGGGDGGQTPAMTAVDMLRASVEAGDAMSAAQTWQTLSQAERDEVAGDDALLRDLLASVADDDALSVFEALKPDVNRILTLANLRGGDPDHYRQVLELVGVEGPAQIAAMAGDLIGLSGFAQSHVLDPLINGEGVTAEDQVALVSSLAGQQLLEAAWGSRFPLDYLTVLTSDDALARQALGQNEVFRTWLLGDREGFSIFILSQPSALEWARALWDAGAADDVGEMALADPVQWGQLFAESLPNMAGSDARAIAGSEPLKSGFLGGLVQYGGDALVLEGVRFLALTMPEAVVALMMAGVLTEELLGQLIAAPGTTVAEQHALASDDIAMLTVMMFYADALPHEVLPVLAADPVAFTDATIQGAMFAGWVARDETTLRTEMLAVVDWPGWVKSFVHYGNWELFLKMAADPALTADLRAAMISENAYNWLVTSADKPIADDAMASALLELYGDGSGIALQDKYTTWKALYQAKLASAGDALVYEWTHSTGALWWEVTYSHRKSYVAINPDDDAMNLFFHQYRQIPRTHIDTADAYYMCKFRIHQVTPDDGSPVYYKDGDGNRIAAPGQEAMPTSYYMGSRNSVVMQAQNVAGSPQLGAPNTARLNGAPADYTDRSPTAVNTPGTDPLSPGSAQALTLFQNHATHEVGHAVGAKTLNAGGYNISGNDWSHDYAEWKDDGQAEEYARQLGFTSAMDDTDYTLSHDSGATICETDGEEIREFLTNVASGEDVSDSELVEDLGSEANAFTALDAHPVLKNNMLVKTVDRLRGSLPNRCFRFPFGIPGGGDKVHFFSTREGDQWVTYKRAAYDNKVSHYSVSSHKEMFAEIYTAKYTGGALPPAIGSHDPQAFFTALDNADPADFGLSGGGGSSGETRAGGDEEEREQRPPEPVTEGQSDGWDQGPNDGTPWP